MAKTSEIRRQQTEHHNDKGHDTTSPRRGLSGRSRRPAAPSPAPAVRPVPTAS